MVEGDGWGGAEAELMVPMVPLLMVCVRSYVWPPDDFSLAAQVTGRGGGSKQ
jgi:hypothetical protein